MTHSRVVFQCTQNQKKCRKSFFCLGERRVEEGDRQREQEREEKEKQNCVCVRREMKKLINEKRKRKEKKKNHENLSSNVSERFTNN